MLDYYGPDIGMRMARKHISWYSNGMANSANFRASINQLIDPLEVKTRIKEFYNE